MNYVISCFSRGNEAEGVNLMYVMNECHSREGGNPPKVAASACNFMVH